MTRNKKHIFCPLGVPKTFLIFGESGGTSRPHQLAEWFGLCDLVAERDRKRKYLLYTQQYTCHEHHAYNSDGIHHQTQNILFHNRTILRVLL